MYLLFFGVCANAIDARCSFFSNVKTTWPTSWNPRRATDLLTISFEMAYGKSLLKSVKMQTQSGPVLYTNLLGIVPMLLFASAGGEFGDVQEQRQKEILLTGPALALLALGSIAGTGIGYSSWWYVLSFFPAFAVFLSSTKFAVEFLCVFEGAVGKFPLRPSQSSVS